jgi:signal transduction histidine kinase
MVIDDQYRAVAHRAIVARGGHPTHQGNPYEFEVGSSRCENRRMRRVGWFAAWVAGLTLAVASVGFVRRDPDLAFAASVVEIVAEVLAGGALIAGGLVIARRGASRAFGLLLVAGGCGWFLLEWNNPGVGSALVFTVGLVLYAAAPPFIAHGLLVYPSRKLRAAGNMVVAIGYSWSLLLLGLLSALIYDPAAHGCFQCPRNLLLIDGSFTVYRRLNHFALYLGLAWSVLVLALLVWRLARATPARRLRQAPVLISGCAYLGLVAADLATSLSRGYLSNDPIDRKLRLAQAAAIVAMTLALAWSAGRPRRTRSRLARLVLDLSSAPSAGGLEPALSRALDDPDLRLAYPVGGGRYIDAEGHPTVPPGSSTALLRGGIEVARVIHRPGLLDDPGLVDALAVTARLALDIERLRAELLAHLAELRSSRARVVATGDRERRRLERDLHDGAQQRLVALTLELGLLRARLQARTHRDSALLARVAEAEGELRGALQELRALASGIFPAVLADEGLAAAVEALAEDQPGTIRIVSLPEQRLKPEVESAAYRVVANTVKRTLRTPVSVAARADEEMLVVEIASNGPIPDLADLGDLEDRVGALDGTIEVHQADGHARIRAEIPCES